MGKKPLTERDKQFFRVFTIAVLIAIGLGLFTLFFIYDYEIVIIAILGYLLAFEFFVFIWVFKLNYYFREAMNKAEETKSRTD